MFRLITEEHKKRISSLLNRIETNDYQEYAPVFELIIQMIYDDIPDKKRISYGRYTVLKRVGPVLYSPLSLRNTDIQELSSSIYLQKNHSWELRALALQLLTIHGAATDNPQVALPLIEEAAADEEWEVRECASGFVRQLIFNNQEIMHSWYLKMVMSDNPFKRRFASESLRPVADNGWFKKHPEFAFSIIKNLYKEKDKYPRTSVGNSLSDWMRIDEEKTVKIVEELAGNGNENSHWIAYRACRNLVKKKPILVMKILKTDSYQYKNRKYNLS